MFRTVPIGLIIEKSLLTVLLPGKTVLLFLRAKQPAPFTGKKQHLQSDTYVLDSVHRTGTLE